jgi:hypothetical protein
MHFLHVCQTFNGVDLMLITNGLVKGRAMLDKICEVVPYPVV